MAKGRQKYVSVKPKERYKLTNWSSYNQSLKERGKISIWLSDEVQSYWFYDAPYHPGGKIIYSDVAITFCLTIKYLYGLAYRQTAGFIEDLFQLLSIDLPVPSYSQIQRRSQSVPINIRMETSSKATLDLVIDSTGLKVYGEGDGADLLWKVRKHGWQKRRTWCKLHMGSDGNDLEIVAVVLTTNDVDDAEAGQTIIQKSTQEVFLKSVAGDGAYDKKKFRTCIPKKTKQLIPPQHNAVLTTNKKVGLEQRDAAIKRIQQIGRAEWKTETGYHIRSKSEVNMYRYKKIFGSEMSARKIPYEETEVKMKCKILNKFVELGMPKSYKVAS